jgi:ubiquinone/menaquinone biosynthesis C-methylase UbiE
MPGRLFLVPVQGQKVEPDRDPLIILGLYSRLDRGVRMRADPDHTTYLHRWSALYEGKNYDEGLAGYFLAKSHEWCERRFSEKDTFARTLEVGAGTGVHLRYVRHRFDEYVMTDLNPPMLAQAAKRASGNVVVEAQDASKLTYNDEVFDRVIATHILEHLPEPHRVLREWVRVLKPGGILSIVLPCDPGFAWRFGRRLGPRKTFTEAGIDYDYWMAREHINPINNLVAFLRFYFEDKKEQWLPLRIPSMDANLFYIVHITK